MCWVLFASFFCLFYFVSFGFDMTAALATSVIVSCSWYHPSANRHTALVLLRDNGTNGRLVRAWHHFEMAQHVALLQAQKHTHTLTHTLSARVF